MPSESSPDEPIWLDRRTVDAFHAELLSEHGGSPGVRDSSLIESALARPRQRFAYDPDADLPRLSAAYAYGLVQNHGYVDGNKRVGAAAMDVFLLLNGWEIETSEPELVAAILATASGEWDEETLAAWIRERTVPFVEEAG
jgi:death-on-curing protein